MKYGGKNHSSPRHKGAFQGPCTSSSGEGANGASPLNRTNSCCWVLCESNQVMLCRTTHRTSDARGDSSVCSEGRLTFSSRASSPQDQRERKFLPHPSLASCRPPTHPSKLVPASGLNRGSPQLGDSSKTEGPPSFCRPLTPHGCHMPGRWLGNSQGSWPQFIHPRSGASCCVGHRAYPKDSQRKTGADLWQAQWCFPTQGGEHRNLLLWEKMRVPP